MKIVAIHDLFDEWKSNAFSPEIIRQRKHLAYVNPLKPQPQKKNSQRKIFVDEIAAAKKNNKRSPEEILLSAIYSHLSIFHGKRIWTDEILNYHTNRSSYSGNLCWFAHHCRVSGRPEVIETQAHTTNIKTKTTHIFIEEECSLNKQTQNLSVSTCCCGVVCSVIFIVLFPVRRFIIIIITSIKIQPQHQQNKAWNASHNNSIIMTTCALAWF